MRTSSRQRRTVSFTVLAIATAVLTALAGGGVAFGETPAAGPVRAETRSGPVIGTATTQSRVFKGIPFAAPPTPERGLRWRPPQPPDPWTAARDATEFGPKCAQPAFVGDASVSEDCLSLNVYAPASGTNLPVMVWIHGGAFFLGAGSNYNPEVLASGNDVVVVTLNYRLGAFGYLALPGLALENEHLSAGNYALQDQQMALRWVRDNIAGFGGDPDSVTLFGESAGAANICAHLASPRSAGLFHRVITSSLSCSSAAATMTKAVAQARSLRYAGKVGCSQLLPRALVACMRQKTAAQLLAAFGPPSESAGAGLLGFSESLVIQSVDGYYLPRTVRDAIRTGQFARVPLLTGTTRDEGRLIALTDFEWAGRPLTNDTYAKRIAEFLEPTVGIGSGLTAVGVAAFYPTRDFPAPPGYDPERAPASLAFGAWFTDFVFSCPHQRMYDQLRNRSVATYAYEFADPDAPLYARGTKVSSRYFPVGAAHGTEIPYVLGAQVEGTTPYEGMTAQQRVLSQQMQRYWANFARTGDPNGPGLAPWPRYGSEILRLQPSGSQAVTRTAFAGEHRCGLWNTVDPIEPTLFSILLFLP